MLSFCNPLFHPADEAVGLQRLVVEHFAFLLVAPLLVDFPLFFFPPDFRGFLARLLCLGPDFRLFTGLLHHQFFLLRFLPSLLLLHLLQLSLPPGYLCLFGGFNALTLFPQLIAGPIVRYSDVEKINEI